MWLLGTGTGLYLLAQIGITSFVVLFLHEHRGRLDGGRRRASWR